MTIEEAKKVLNSYKEKKRSLNIYKLKIQELERKCMDAGMTFAGLPSVQGGEHHDLHDVILELMDLKDEYWRRYAEIEKYCSEVIETSIYKVAEVNVLYANILTYYYVHSIKLLDIAVEMNYSYRSIKKYYHQSIQCIANVNVNPQSKVEVD